MRDGLGPDGDADDGREPDWGVDEAIVAMHVLGEFDPWWIEEPTSPDDVLGHARIRREIAPIRVATGEHVQNRVVFKQLFQAEAIDVCQIDACRLGGVNEVLAVLLLAAQASGSRSAPTPAASGSASTSSTSRSSTTSASAERSRAASSSGSTTCTSTSATPRSSADGRYLAPTAPGYSIEMLPTSLDAFRLSGRSDVDRRRRCSSAAEA